MPVRSLTSSVLRWPDLPTVRESLKRWVAARVEGRRDVVRIGCFGSFARGDWGVGSDLDLVVVVDESAEPFERRAARWDTADLPVPADVLVYTDAEWRALSGQRPFRPPLTRETQWLYVRQEGGLRL